eukprot:g72348.t1
MATEEKGNGGGKRERSGKEEKEQEISEEEQQGKAETVQEKVKEYEELQSLLETLGQDDSMSQAYLARGEETTGRVEDHEESLGGFGNLEAGEISGSTAGAGIQNHMEVLGGPSYRNRWTHPTRRSRRLLHPTPRLLHPTRRIQKMMAKVIGGLSYLVLQDAEENQHL